MDRRDFGKRPHVEGEEDNNQHTLSFGLYDCQSDTILVSFIDRIFSARLFLYTLMSSAIATLMVGGRRGPFLLPHFPNGSLGLIFSFRSPISFVPRPVFFSRTAVGSSPRLLAD